MSDDLTTANEGQPVEPIADDAAMELPDICAEIQACCSAIETMEGVDTVVLGNIYGVMKKRMVKRAFKILDEHIKYLYDCTFDSEDDDD